MHQIKKIRLIMKGTSILRLYAYFICAICTCSLIVFFYVILSSVTSILLPEYMNFHKLQKYRSLEAYKASNREYKKVSNKKLIIIKNKNHSLEIQSIKVGNIGSIINSSLAALIVCMFFFVHWKIGRHRIQS